ncbi:hypothetical protein DIPPA_02023 [Diplonema papillatum]|nr:hypothetical protein DIPPA_02023 [Diplonema papillatum]
MLQPRPPPVQRTERPVNPRTQQEEEALLTHPGGRTTGNASWKASGASAARGNEKGDGDDRTGDQKAATNARNQRTTSAEEKGARHPEGRPDRRPQAEEDEGDHPRLRGASKEEEGTEGKQLSETTGDHGHTNALESEKRTHVAPPSYSPTQSLESQESQTPLAPQMLDLDDAMAGDDVIR